MLIASIPIFGSFFVFDTSEKQILIKRDQLLEIVLFMHGILCLFCVMASSVAYRQVWEMSRESDRAQMPPCLHAISNIAPVARVKWRPQRKAHISSCSLHIDTCVNVWDVARPYIPFAAFDGHTDVATCELGNFCCCV